MRWGVFFGVSVLMLLMFLYEWPKMKTNPLRDKVAFLSLMAIGFVLSMFDLPNLPGPNSWVQKIFEPLAKIMEK